MIAVMGEMPVDRASLERLALQGRGETLPVLVLSGLCGQTDHFQYAWIKVRADDRLLANHPCPALAGPLHDHGYANATLVQPALGPSERQVGGRVGPIELILLNDPSGVAEIPCRHPSVVGVKDDDGVVRLAHFIELFQHATQALVHRLHHGRELDVVLALLDLDRALRQHLVTLMRRLAQKIRQFLARQRGLVVRVALEDERRPLKWR